MRTEQEIEKAKFEFVEARENEWLDKAWDRIGRKLGFELEEWEERWKREKPVGPEFDIKRRFWYEARLEELRNEAERQLEIQKKRWRQEFDEEFGEEEEESQ